MKACPNCYLSFNDGYICPHCGGQLVDYHPDQQAQSSTYQNSYYDQPQQSPAHQVQPVPSAPAQSHQQSSYYQMPANNFPPTIIKKRTGLVVFLLLLVLALGAFGGYLVYEEYQERTNPTELETAVVHSAWEWYSNVDGMFTKIEELNPPSEEDTSGSVFDRGASSSKKTADQAAGQELTNEIDSGVAAAEGDTTAIDGENVEAVAASPKSSPTSPEDAASVHNSDVVPQDGTTGGAASNAGADETDALNDAATGNTGALTESMELLGDSVSEAIAATVALAILTDTDYLESVDEPMQALKEKYPDLVSSWDGVKSSIDTEMREPTQIKVIAQKFRQAGESFKRTAEKAGITL